MGAYLSLFMIVVGCIVHELPVGTFLHIVGLILAFSGTALLTYNLGRDE